MLFFLLFIFLSASAAHIVLRPPEGAKGSNVGLVLVPGAMLRPQQYVALAEVLRNYSSCRLWIGIVGDFLVDIPNPIEIDSKTNATLTSLWEAGLPRSAPLVAAGHSLGGVIMEQHVRATPHRFAATLLLAAYLPLGRLRDFPTPVLHLSGDLDGVTRITRILRVYRELTKLQAKAGSSAAALKLTVTRPIALMPGQNHGQFATGPLSHEVISNDIRAEVSDEEARLKVAAVTNAFLMANLFNRSFYKGVLYSTYAHTTRLMQPLMTAEDLDAVNGSSSIAEAAQRHVIAALPSADSVDIASHAVDSFKAIVWAKPEIEENVTVTSVVFAARPYDVVDTATSPVTTEQLVLKMKRREAVAEALNETEPKAAEVSCKDLNAMVLRRAKQLAAAKAMQRYEASGRGELLQEDVNRRTGLSWLLSRLQLTYGKDLVVRSAAMKTGLSDSLFSTAGMHNCQLLSVARALEWIYVDSLKPWQEK